jgi:hypothetical protein
MSTANEVVVIQREHRVGRVQKLGVENNLDTVRGVVEKLYSPNLVQNWVRQVIGLDFRSVLIRPPFRI